MDYRDVLEELNGCRIGHTEACDIGLNFLTGYLPLDVSVYEQQKEKGRLLHSVFAKANSLYREAIMRNDRYVLGLIEGGIRKDRRLREGCRKIFLERAHRLPVIFRGDSPDLEQFVEFQTGIRGLGYVFGFRKVLERHLGEAAFLTRKRFEALWDAYLGFVKKEAPVLAFPAEIMRMPELNYLMTQLSGGRAVEITPKSWRFFWQRKTRQEDLIKQGEGAGAVLLVAPRHFYNGWTRRVSFSWNGLLQKIVFNGWYELAQRYLKGVLDIEPPPNLLYENKILTALVRDPATRDFFNDDERGIFPESYVIKKGARMIFDGVPTTLEDIVALPKNQRRFVVKYAGLDFTINFGGRRVFRLKTLSKKSVARILQRALDLYEKRGEPWILQKDISSKREVAYFDIREKQVKTGALYALFRPYFMYDPVKKEVDVMDILVLFRDNFKVHAMKDCACGVVSFVRHEK